MAASSSRPARDRGEDAAARPRLLDLFCGAGGAAMGYHRAGFDVVGVDIEPQPNYPFAFHQADALQALGQMQINMAPTLWGVRFDAIHASPPCQHYSDLAHRNGNAHEHPDLIAEVRGLLEATGLPYVLENVEGAPLRDPVVVCGTRIGRGIDGYRLRRHRLFEANWALRLRLKLSPEHGLYDCGCHGDPRPVMDVSGGGPSHAPRLDGKGGRTYKGTADQVRAIMGMPWATKAECNEAIPPAYTALIGRHLLDEIREKVAA